MWRCVRHQTGRQLAETALLQLQHRSRTLGRRNGGLLSVAQRISWPEHVRPLQSVDGAQIDLSVAHHQVVALDQQEAEIAGQVRLFESQHVLFFLMRPVRQTDTPELVLRFHSFDTRLHFRRRELPNPGDAELCLFGPALQLVPTFNCCRRAPSRAPPDVIPIVCAR